ncbi:general L-amino acid transport system substrate-binding protein [Mesorhizobium albiziae]|uniref:General L-amino acid transport system substrate-binding protein n=1 Tax=Neomesorhizobium albiziae TaxID=335020 RepID=A0A1I4D9M5_9HYPH|nr:amino acid ABC transporter substrate-binding protein [Mesorhizobium albiziae]GLS33578.1 amino acid ABC transporter substrate-binding protein [Mesorhizobium albiziae]SFK89713.1 general L-amino acid transport system substrate-binding protein [Mesorhizobium albiziae]
MKHMFASTLLLAGMIMAAPAAADTLDIVKQRGTVTCGVSQGVAGFSAPDDQGRWKGFDIDICRAVAAAVFGDPERVSYVPLSTKDRFTALQTGTVDLLSRQTTWTLSRDSGLGIHFVGTAYYDGQGFMVRKDLGVDSALKLSGATVCAEQGTTTEQNVADYFGANNLKYETVVIDSAEGIVKAFDSGRCDVYTTDASALYAQRLRLAEPAAYTVLPEIISKEPLGPAVRQGDDKWFNIVRWTLFALLEAEELGVTQATAEAGLTSANPVVRRFLGAEGDNGQQLGLDPRFAYNIVSKVGNFGEVFDRNLGQSSELKIDRGINALWNAGGLMYAPPLR